MSDTVKYQLLAFILMLLVALPVSAEDAEQSADLLIRNVALITDDADGEAEDTVVNILIRDRKLDIVTKD